MIKELLSPEEAKKRMKAIGKKREQVKAIKQLEEGAEMSDAESEKKMEEQFKKPGIKQGEDWETIKEEAKKERERKDQN